MNLNFKENIDASRAEDQKGRKTAAEGVASDTSLH